MTSPTTPPPALTMEQFKVAQKKINDELDHLISQQKELAEKFPGTALRMRLLDVVAALLQVRLQQNTL